MKGTRRAMVTAAVVAATLFTGVEPANSAQPANSIVSITVTPTPWGGSTNCQYSVAVSVTHRGPVHIDALATDGTTSWGGGNRDILGSGAHSFVEEVYLPDGVTATFFSAMYYHRGPSMVRLDYEAESAPRTCDASS